MPKSIVAAKEVPASEFYSVEDLLALLPEGLEHLDAQKLHRTPPYTIASFLNRLSVDECRTVLRKVPELDASEILAEMDADSSADIVAAMREWRALKILEEFDLDDAADVISELEEPDRVRLLAKLSTQKAKQVRELLAYDPDTAGGVMNPKVLSVRIGMTVDEAIGQIRRLGEEDMGTSYVYVIDRQKKLRGVFTMRQLILAKSSQLVDELMETDLKGVCTPGEDKEKIALAMAELNLFDLPVVDEQGRLLGVVEHDDVIDIIQSEATEDFQKLVGAGGDEAIHDDIGSSLKLRGPWLVVNLATALLAAAVISFFQEEIEALSLLAVFMPAVASLGGNAGAQTLAVAIRSMAVGDVERLDSTKICLMEGFKGLLNGMLVGIVASGTVYAFTKDMKMTLVVFMALIFNMFLGGVAGAFIPIFLKRFGFDPAQSSAIFLNGFTDVCGFFIFLSLGAWLLF